MDLGDRRLVTSALLGLVAIAFAVGANVARAAGGPAMVIILPTAAGASGMYLGVHYLERRGQGGRWTAYAAIAANLLGVVLALGLWASLILSE